MTLRVKNLRLRPDDPLLDQKINGAVADQERQGFKVKSLSGPVPLESGELLYALILEPAAVPQDASLPPGMWQCPDCGEMMPDDDSVCSICLARRPGS